MTTIPISTNNTILAELIEKEQMELEKNELGPFIGNTLLTKPSLTLDLKMEKNKVEVNYLSSSTSTITNNISRFFYENREEHF